MYDNVKVNYMNIVSINTYTKIYTPPTIVEWDKVSVYASVGQFICHVSGNVPVYGKLMLKFKMGLSLGLRKNTSFAYGRLNHGFNIGL